MFVFASAAAFGQSVDSTVKKLLESGLIGKSDRKFVTANLVSTDTTKKWIVFTLEELARKKALGKDYGKEGTFLTAARPRRAAKRKQKFNNYLAGLKANNLITDKQFRSEQVKVNHDQYINLMQLMWSISEPYVQKPLQTKSVESNSPVPASSEDIAIVVDKLFECGLIKKEEKSFITSELSNGKTTNVDCLNALYHLQEKRIRGINYGKSSAWSYSFTMSHRKKKERRESFNDYLSKLKACNLINDQLFSTERKKINANKYGHLYDLMASVSH